MKEEDYKIACVKAALRIVNIAHDTLLSTTTTTNNSNNNVTMPSSSSSTSPIPSTININNNVSVYEHFKYWEKNGMTMSGNIYEVSIVVEGYKSSGKSNISNIKLDIPNL
jgi:hypothetical protein